MKIVCVERTGSALEITQKRLMLLTVATFVLAGCESIPDLPDAMNPMSWFSDDEKTTVAAQPDSTVPYPKLKSVPERPKIPTLAEQQARIAQGLTADTENARYTDAQIRKEVQKRTVAPASRTLPKTAISVPSAPVPAASVPAPRMPPVLSPVLTPMQAKAAPVAPPPPNYQSLKYQNKIPATSTKMNPPPLRRPALAAAPPTMQPTQPVSTPQPVNGLIQIASIYFADGSTVVQRADKSILGQIADAQKQSGGILEIVGHASGRANTFDAARRSAINYEVREIGWSGSGRLGGASVPVADGWRRRFKTSIFGVHAGGRGGQPACGSFPSAVA